MLIYLEIALAALFFPMFIFSIGYSNRESNMGIRLSEVLLKETFIFPITVYTIFSLFFLIWSRIELINTLIVMITAALLVVILFRIIKILLDDFMLFQRLISLMRDKIRRSMEYAITERIGTNIFLSEFTSRDSKFHINQSHFSLTKEIISTFSKQKKEELLETLIFGRWKFYKTI